MTAQFSCPKGTIAPDGQEPLEGGRLKKQIEDLKNNTDLVLLERQTDVRVSVVSEFVTVVQ